MARYGWLCSKCLSFREVECKMEDRNNPQVCECGGDMERQLDIPVIHGSEKGFYNNVEKQVDKRLSDIGEV